LNWGAQNWTQHCRWGLTMGLAPHIRKFPFAISFLILTNLLGGITAMGDEDTTLNQLQVASSLCTKLGVCSIFYSLAGWCATA